MSAGFPTNGTAKLYSDRGHTCVPKDVREELGLEEGDEITFVVDGDEAKIFMESENAVDEEQ